jgi:uncharacterized damage-inducible protein DinB
MLQPVAHGLLQCREEVRDTLSSLGDAELRISPGGAATAEYHVRHAIGSLDRLLTYARGEALTPAQLAALKSESVSNGSTAADLVAAFDEAVERALAQLRVTREVTLLEPRAVGRTRLPSTVIGLLFHAAEHTQRHTGQLVTTARIVRQHE